MTMVRRLAKEYSATLAQLNSRNSTIMKFGVGAGVDPFVMVKSLFTDLINRLQAETSSVASHNFYCDEETSKAIEISRPMLGSNLPNSKRPWPDPPFWTALSTRLRQSSTSLVTLFQRANNCAMLFELSHNDGFCCTFAVDEGGNCGT